MTDRRATWANARVAHVSVRGRAGGRRLVEGEGKSIGVPIADLCAAPDGPRDRQLVLGDEFLVLEVRDGWAFGVARDGGYAGYVKSAALTRPKAATHAVIAPWTHVRDRPDVKAPEVATLVMGSRLAAEGHRNDWVRIEGPLTAGWVPARHLAPPDYRAADPIALAEGLDGVPYLWGGDTPLGIDCSGLVHLCARMAGAPCPRDSDQQRRALGRPADADPRLSRGDLLFWEGHVAIVAAPDRLVHANAHHMAVRAEPLGPARERIEAAAGPLLAVGRLPGAA